MEELQKKTAEVNELFNKKVRNKKWTPEVIMVDLMEETGELSNAILVQEKFKSEKRRKAYLKNSIADVLFDLILLANHYKIDIEKEYIKTIEQLRGRINKNKM